jgi:hypothetical protein
MKITIDRDAAVNNIAVNLFHRGLLNLPPPADASSRLEPFLTLAPVVGVIADAMDKARTEGRRQKTEGRGRHHAHPPRK